MQVTLKLEMPNKKLYPNCPVSWQAKMKPKKKAYKDYFFLAKTIKHPFKLHSKLEVELIVVNKDNRCHDLDNVIAALKSTLDGLFKGMGLDDRQVKSIKAKKSDIFDKNNPHIIFILKEIV